MIIGVITQVLGDRVAPVRCWRGTLLPDDVLLHMGRREVIVVLESTNLFQNGGTAHGQNQRRCGGREQCALCVCVCERERERG